MGFFSWLKNLVGGSSGPADAPAVETPAAPAAPAGLSFDDTSVTWNPGGSDARSVTWDDLQKVVIRTTDQGPIVDDMFYVLTGPDGELAIPNTAPNMEGLLDRFGQLSGFDFKAMIMAQMSTDNAEFPCWEK